MSTRRTSRQGSLRTRLSDGLMDANGSGPQPSRRSSRQRLPTAKAAPLSPNMGAVSTSGNVLTSPGTSETPTHQQRSTRGASSTPKGSAKSEGVKPTQQSQDRKNNGSAIIEDATKPNKASSQVNESGFSDEAMVEVAAERLVLLDPRAHNEAVVTDADLLVGRILLPMSLPWSHDSTLSVRTMPHDIDELPGLLFAGQKSTGTMFGGILNKPLSENDGGVTVTTRRSLDPGVIELVRKVEPPRDPDEEEDLIAKAGLPPPSSAGEQKLASFREALALKRQRQSRVSSEPAETRLVSFCFGQSSSRKTLFPDNPSSKKRPLLLSAGYSEDFQRGKRIRVQSANAISRELGSYDYRYGLPPAEHSSSRIRAGRTRLIWSSKHLSSQRPTYRSLITGMTFESGGHKRPISIMVGVRVNGKRLEWDKDPEKASHSNEDVEAALSKAFGDEAGSEASAHDRKLPPSSEEPRSQPSDSCPQCSLDTSKVISCFVERGLAHHKEFQIKYGNPTSALYVLPPVFHSIPTEDGVVRTICWKPGRIANTDLTNDKAATSSIDATRFLLDFPKQSMACSVCWSSSTDREDICVCSRCGLRAHVSCHPGDHIGSPKHVDPEWMCNECKLRPPIADSEQLKESSENPRSVSNQKRCSVCPVVGGVMSPYDNSETGWCHDVCQVWCNNNMGSAIEIGQCVLCSRKDSKVIRCAAKGCSVRFHPMCAVLSSQLARYHWIQQKVALQVPNKTGNASSRHEAEEKGQDVSIECMQFKLIATRIGARNSGRKLKEHTLHLGLCGIHNQSRLPEFCGLPPGGDLFQDAMRVPPLPARELDSSA